MEVKRKIRKVSFLTDEEKQFIIKEYSLGKSCYSIGQNLNRSLTAIQMFVDKNFKGRKYYKYVARGKDTHYLTMEEKQTIKRMFENNETIITIGRAIDRNKSTVYDFIKKNQKNGEIVIIDKKRNSLSLVNLEKRIERLENQVKILSDYLRNNIK
jgi:IS30 family transposase